MSLVCRGLQTARGVLVGAILRAGSIRSGTLVNHCGSCLAGYRPGHGVLAPMPLDRMSRSEAASGHGGMAPGIETGLNWR